MMGAAAEPGATPATHATFALSPQQKTYFETFGFLRIPGLFAPDIERIIGGFEEIFANEEVARMDMRDQLHLNERRVIIPAFIQRSPNLQWLLEDARVGAIVRALIGDDYEYAESDGNLFYCDSSWHSDTYAAPMDILHLKLSFYLDELSGESGAIRFIPGTNHYTTPFARSVRSNVKDPLAISSAYGVEYDEIPSWTLQSSPGDLVVWNFRTVHASFNGGDRRRLFSLNFREPKREAATA